MKRKFPTQRKSNIGRIEPFSEKYFTKLFVNKPSVLFITKKLWIFGLFLIIAIAAFFRIYRITEFPMGLFIDEAMNAYNAVNGLKTGNFDVFYPENNGREGLFINLQAISIAIFGNYVWALRIIPALCGILTVVGTYFLCKKMFNSWYLGYIASFFMAVGFWHVNFSRIGFRAILSPLFLVWTFYFLFKALKTGKIRHFLFSGLFLGLGFHTYIAYRIMPLVVILTLITFLLEKKLSFSKKQFIKGVLLLWITTILVLLPLARYFIIHPHTFGTRVGQLSIFNSKDWQKEIVSVTIKTINMFFFEGDYNLRHNYSGAPVLIWPVSILFFMGLVCMIFYLFKTLVKLKYMPTVETTLLLWFFIGILPGILANEGVPHALRTLCALPSVYIIAGRGAYWIFDFFHRCLHRYFYKDKRFAYLQLIPFALITLLFFKIGYMEFDKYFIKWGPISGPAFCKDHIDVVNKLNSLPQETIKYVVCCNSFDRNQPRVDPGQFGPQVIMFLTDTWDSKKQKEKNIYYITYQQYLHGEYNKKSLLFPIYY